MIDVQNERNVRDRRSISVADVSSIFNAIKSIDSARIAFADNAPVDSAETAARFAASLGLDVTAYHDPRPPNWYELGAIQAVVGAMGANGKPADLQEPLAPHAA